MLLFVRLLSNNRLLHQIFRQLSCQYLWVLLEEVGRTQWFAKEEKAAKPNTNVQLFFFFSLKSSPALK